MTEVLDFPGKGSLLSVVTDPDSFEIKEKYEWLKHHRKNMNKDIKIVFANYNNNMHENNICNLHYNIVIMNKLLCNVRVLPQDGRSVTIGEYFKTADATEDWKICFLYNNDICGINFMYSNLRHC